MELMMALFILSAVMVGVYTLTIAYKKMWYTTSLACSTANEASLAAERFVYGDGWTPGLRAAYSDQMSFSQTSNKWSLVYSTPDSSTNTFSYDANTDTLLLPPGAASAPIHLAGNVTQSSVVLSSDGVYCSGLGSIDGGLVASSNQVNTFVAYRN